MPLLTTRAGVFSTAVAGFTSAVWNGSDKNAAVTVSNPGPNGLTFVTSGDGMVRATKSATGNQKIYYENHVDNQAFKHYVGFGNSSASLTAQPGAADNDGFSIHRNGDAYCNGTGTTLFSAALTTGDNVDVCVIIASGTATLFWARRNNGAWNEVLNGGAGGDPASGTFGFALAALHAGPYFPMAGGWLDQITSNFGTGLTTGFTRTIPFGFTAP